MEIVGTIRGRVQDGFRAENQTGNDGENPSEPDETVLRGPGEVTRATILYLVFSSVFQNVWFLESPLKKHEITI